MTEVRDKSHSLIFLGKKDTPLYRIRKDITEIKKSIEHIENNIEKIMKLLQYDGKI